MSQQPAGPVVPKFGFGAAVVLFLIGIGLLVFCWITDGRVADYQPGAAPECDGQVMGPRDVCIGTNGGDYAEMQQNEADNHEINKKIRIGTLIAGPIFLVLSVLQLIRAIVRSRRWLR